MVEIKVSPNKVNVKLKILNAMTVNILEPSKKGLPYTMLTIKHVACASAIKNNSMAIDIKKIEIEAPLFKKRALDIVLHDFIESFKKTIIGYEITLKKEDQMEFEITD